MRKLILLVCGVTMMMCFLSSCDPHTGRRPINYPNTRWVSENPDMFFEVGEDIVGRQAVYAQITINGEIVEIMCSFEVSGALVYFSDPSGFDSETGFPLEGINSNDVELFRGLCKFGSKKLVVTIDKNEKGFLDDSITEIVFIREDLNE